MSNQRTSGRRLGVSLTELLCVLVILSILSGIYLYSVMRAFVRIKTFLEGLQ